MSNWILLRGLAREARHWETFPDVFRKALNATNVIPVDLPGAGIENLRSAPSTVKEIVDDIRTRIFRSGGPEGEWNILSVSLGGMISLEWCSRYPHDFKHAVLINSSARRISTLFERLTPYAMQTLTQAFLSPSAFIREKIILNATTSFHREDEVIARRWSDYSVENKVSSQNLARQLWAAARFEPPQTIPYTQLLFLNAAGDRFVSPISSYKLSKYYQAPLKTHPNAGHDLTLDDPQWVSDAVKSWLGESATQAVPTKEHFARL